MRRPINGPYRISGDTKEHAEYGVGPATDYVLPLIALPIDTPIVAPFPLERVVRWGGWSFTGGLAINAYSRDGRFMFVGQHLNRWVDNPGLDEGDVIGYSGNSGALTTGGHLHCYVIVLATGRRLSFEEFMREYGPKPASSKPKPIVARPISKTPTTTQEDEDDMAAPRQIHYTNKVTKKTHRALLVPGTGYFVRWTEGGATYANNIARGFETGSSVEVTESVFNVFEREAKAMRPKDALSIEVAEA